MRQILWRIPICFSLFGPFLYANRRKLFRRLWEEYKSWLALVETIYQISTIINMIFSKRAAQFKIHKDVYRELETMQTLSEKSFVIFNLIFLCFLQFPLCTVNVKLSRQCWSNIYKIYTHSRKAQLSAGKNQK